MAISVKTHFKPVVTCNMVAFRMVDNWDTKHYRENTGDKGPTSMSQQFQSPN